MMEAVRSLGFAARFVSGYLYDPALDGGPSGTQGAGATHAWVQVYLPGAGWVEFDPTNGIVGGRNLIRVGVARDPKQAIPLAGTFFGAPSDYLGTGGRGAGDAIAARRQLGHLMARDSPPTSRTKLWRSSATLLRPNARLRSRSIREVPSTGIGWLGMAQQPGQGDLSGFAIDST